MTWTEIAVAVAQVAAGGGIVQAVLALTRRRSELRKLDRDADAVHVETADQLLGMLRAELNDAKVELREARSAIAQLKTEHAQEIARLQREHNAERIDQQRQIETLASTVSDLRAELAVARSEIARLQDARER